uniref:Uncharacterized protein n=1 Tax=Timema poppense TaxID=170557 RepID=A0A7R9H3A4_TIMPO|nr:unnamed protein product [Timema poppensis]
MYTQFTLRDRSLPLTEYTMALSYKLYHSGIMKGVIGAIDESRIPRQEVLFYSCVRYLLWREVSLKRQEVLFYRCVRDLLWKGEVSLKRQEVLFYRCVRDLLWRGEVSLKRQEVLFYSCVRYLLWREVSLKRQEVLFYRCVRDLLWKGEVSLKRQEVLFYRCVRDLLWRGEVSLKRQEVLFYSCVRYLLWREVSLKRQEVLFYRCVRDLLWKGEVSLKRQEVLFYRCVRDLLWRGEVSLKRQEVLFYSCVRYLLWREVSLKRQEVLFYRCINFQVFAQCHPLPGNPEYGDKVARVNRKTLLISLVCGLPCIAAELYLYYGYQREVAFAHLGSALIPVAVKLLMGNNSAHNSVDWVTAGNLLSIFVVTFLENNYYGFAMTACYTVNYFLITTECVFGWEMPEKRVASRLKRQSGDLGGLGDYSTPVVSVTSRDTDRAWYKPGMIRAAGRCDSRAWHKLGLIQTMCVVPIVLSTSWVGYKTDVIRVVCGTWHMKYEWCLVSGVVVHVDYGYIVDHKEFSFSGEDT